jgi:hypothetical protein
MREGVGERAGIGRPDGPITSPSHTGHKHTEETNRSIIATITVREVQGHAQHLLSPSNTLTYGIGHGL